MFMDGYPDGIEGRASLFRILAGYARYNKEVGYCQGEVQGHHLIYHKIYSSTAEHFYAVWSSC